MPCGKRDEGQPRNLPNPSLPPWRRGNTKGELIKIPEENRKSRNSVNWREGKNREEKTPNWILQKTTLRSYLGVTLIKR